MKWVALFCMGLGVSLIVAIGALYQSAFGGASCRGVNPIAAMLFVSMGVGVYTLIIYFIFNSIDWLNDMIAARTVTKQNNESVKGMADINRALLAQVRTMSGAISAHNKISRQPVNGGLMYDEEPDELDMPVEID